MLLNTFVFAAFFWGEANAVNNNLQEDMMENPVNANIMSLSNSNFSGKNAKDINHSWIKAKYQLESEKEIIGELSSERKAFITDKGFEITITGTMQISIDSFWGKYNFLSDEEVVIDEKGLNRYQGEFQEDTKKSTVNIDLKDSQVRIHGSSEDEQRFEYKFTREDFDAVSENAAWIFVKSGAKEKRLKVLDLDNFEIEDVIYHYQKKDNIDIKGENFACHLIAFTTPAKQGEQCVVLDKTGAWIAHESGKDENGEYSVTLTELTYSKNR
jgi:hypothetical protein